MRSITDQISDYGTEIRSLEGERGDSDVGVPLHCYEDAVEGSGRVVKAGAVEASGGEIEGSSDTGTNFGPFGFGPHTYHNNCSQRSGLETVIFHRDASTAATRLECSVNGAYSHEGGSRRRRSYHDCIVTWTVRTMVAISFICLGLILGVILMDRLNQRKECNCATSNHQP